MVNKRDEVKLRKDILKIELYSKLLLFLHSKDNDAIESIAYISGHAIVVYNSFLNGILKNYDGDIEKLLDTADFERDLILSRNINLIKSYGVISHLTKKKRR